MVARLSDSLNRHLRTIEVSAGAYSLSPCGIGRRSLHHKLARARINDHLRHLGCIVILQFRESNIVRARSIQ